MKKTYNSPEMKMVKIAQHHMIATSIIVGRNNYNGTSTIEVKRDRSASYDVWDDDWSK